MMVSTLEYLLESYPRLWANEADNLKTTMGIDKNKQTNKPKSLLSLAKGQEGNLARQKTLRT